MGYEKVFTWCAVDKNETLVFYEKVPITREQVERVIDAIYDVKSVSKALFQSGVLRKQFYAALSEYPDLGNKYLCARESVADEYADEIIEIADTENDSAKARNQIDSRKWIASKLKPNTYGDRLDISLNQTVDIGSALSEAMKRVPLMQGRSNDETEKRQLSKVIDVTPNSTTGAEPEARTNQAESTDASKLALEDLLK